MRSALLMTAVVSAQWLSAAEPIWKPAPQTTWQWQLTEKLDISPDVEMFDVDLYTTTKEEVAAIHGKGSRAVCYLSAGTFEPWRPDSAAFPESVKGRAVAGWADERWLDIRRLDVLRPIMEARLDLCKAKGFDGVEPDNVDAYTNKSGFPLTGDDQLKYNRFLAAAAHARGLSVGLKNDVDQVKELVADFDWALNESCFQYKECDTLKPFTAAGKAVFHVEYKMLTSAFCSRANSLDFNSMRKGVDLDVPRELCRERPAPALGEVVNAGSLAGGGVAAGEIVVLLGSGFGPSMPLTAAASEEAFDLGGTSVVFDETAARLLSVGPGQASVIVPSAVTGQAQTVARIQRLGVKSEPLTLDVLVAHPGLFTKDSSGKGQLTATHEDGTMNGASNAARLGSVITLWGSGFVDAAITAEVGGFEAEVVWAGPAVLAMPGVFQINIRIPVQAPVSEPAGVVLKGTGGSTQNQVWVAVSE